MIAVGVVFAVLLAVPLAVLAAPRAGGVTDQLVRAVPLVGLGMPPFWIGFVLLLVLAQKWKLFPTGGYGFTFTEHVSSLILPGATIAIAMAPILVRSLRAALIEILGSDYITAARGKGLRPARVLVRHALRNTAIPGVSVLAVNLGLLLGGTAVIENVYGLPGVGNLLLTAIFNRDFDMVQSVTLVYAIIVVIINLAADLAYAALDPRVVLGR
jgi:peptide/nickel transport system permease protein